jgi:hypothetical protein
MRRLYEVEHVVVKVYVEEVRDGLPVDALSVLSEDAKEDPVNLKEVFAEVKWQRNETYRFGVFLA